jgi:uncharacterized protein with PIN domain
MKEPIISMLNELSELQAQVDLLAIDKQRAVDAVLTPEIKAALADIEAEFTGMGAEATRQIDYLTQSIKTSVLALGETVKATGIQAVYTKGRESWDSKGLAGYAVAHPEIEVFRKIGEPSISIRRVS